MEIIVAIIVMASMVSLIICAYGKQQEKHIRMRKWMKEHQRQLKNNKRNNKNG